VKGWPRVKQRSLRHTTSCGRISRLCERPSENDKKSKEPRQRSCGSSKRRRAKFQSQQVNVGQSEMEPFAVAPLTCFPGKTQAPDLGNARASAGAYFSSWGSWATEKRKGWGNRSVSANQSPATSPHPGDVKRAEEFQRDKGASLDGSTLHSSSRNSGHKRIASYDERTDGEDTNNGGVFFDAEVAEQERNAWRA
jgi:hypothetical protein